MWSLLPRRFQLAVVLVTGILLAYSLDAGWALITGEGSGLLKWVSLVVVLIGVVLAGLAQFFWFRLLNWWPWLQTKTFPDLNGTWQGRLVSTWQRRETGDALHYISATTLIRQTLFSTHVSMHTDESKSESTRAFLEPFYDTRRYRLWYSYNNDPMAQFKRRSSPHEGVAYLDLQWDVDRDRLTGRYYTDRETSGDVELRRTSASPD